MSDQDHSNQDQRDQSTFSRREFAALAVGGAALIGGAVPAMAQESASSRPIVEPTQLVSAHETMRPEILGDFGIVAAGRHYTVAAGTRILLQGGNATDAGVAAVFAASVVEISHFGFGGESPTLIFDSTTAKVSLINGQGFAPGLATPDKFAAAGVIPGNGPNGGTVPAMLDAMALALQLNGTMTLHQVMQPALEYADGFVMYDFLAEVFRSEQKATSKYKTAYDTYYPGGQLPKVGAIFCQPNLAHTMRIIAEASRAEYSKSKNRHAAIQAGRDAFYKGDIARRFGAAVEADGGLMRYEDLARYKGKIETPTMTSVFGYSVYKAGFWNQGPALLMALNIAEAAGIATMQPGSDQYLHTMAESIKLAFDDRNAYFGDPDFATVPAKGLLSKDYGALRAKLIGPSASLEHRYGDPWAFEGRPRTTAVFIPHALKSEGAPTGDTTSVQVVDKHGNLFSCTPSSAWLLGGAYIAGDTGVPMSNRLTVFDLDSESPNVLVPYKRPRTTLTPSIVLKDGKPYLAIGTPGGDNQDQQIMNVLLRILAFNQPLQASIEAPRINSKHFHNSFAVKRDEPGVLEIESGVPVAVRDALTARGHKLEVLKPFGVSTGIVAVGVVPETSTLRGGSDVRRERYAFGW